MNQYLAMGRNYRTHDEVMAELIYPIFLSKAEEGRKARFHQHLEAHLEEFWPDWERHHPSPYVENRGAKMKTWCQNPQQPMEVL